MFSFYLPNKFTTILSFLSVLVRVHVFFPLDPVHHQLLVLLLLLRSALDDNDVDVFKEDDASGHEELLGIRLHFKLLRRIRKTLQSEKKLKGLEVNTLFSILCKACETQPRLEISLLLEQRNRANKMLS